MTLSIKDTKHNDTLRYAECHYAGCRVLFILMLTVVMLNVIRVSVVAPTWRISAVGLVVRKNGISGTKSSTIGTHSNEPWPML